MKKIFFITFLCLPLTLLSQGRPDGDWSGFNEIKVTVGFPPIQGLMVIYQFPNIFTDAERYENMEVRYRVPTFGVEYGYNLKRWLEIGGGLYYGSIGNKMMYAASGEYMGVQWTHLSTLLVNVKFNWFNSKWVRLFSSIAAGVTMVNTNWSESSVGDEVTTLHFSAGVTLFGMTVGRKVYGTVQLGSSYSGLVSVGVGCRF